MSTQEPVCLLTEGQAPHFDCAPADDRSSDNYQNEVSLVAAINRKYCSAQCSILQCGSAIFMKANDHLPGKRRPSGSLELLILNEQQISVAGDLCQLSPLVRNITELDLAFNQLSNWREVLTMLTQMPHLVHANLSHNPLSGPLTKEDDWLAESLTNGDDGKRAMVMRKMTNLVLNATGILWESLFTLLDIMPNLEELHLSLNNYSRLLDGGEDCIIHSGNTFPHIHNLHLNHCQLKSWRELLTICRLFPCVETLIAAGNSIPAIGDSDDSVEAELAEYFGCLHTLNINYWPINNWDDVEKLRKVPLLSELRINHVTLLQAYEEADRRHLLIARLPDVTLLNGSPVTIEQRENAERFFIRFYLDKEEKPERYFELESVHGRLMPLADIDLSPKDCADVVLVMDGRRECRRISLNQTVVQLKKSLQSFCHMPPGRFRLFIRRGLVEDPYYLEELKLPRIMLHSLHVEDDDEFHIQAKPDPPARRRTSSSNSALCSADSPSKGASPTCTTCGSISNPVNQR